MSEVIYKIAPRHEWEAAVKDGTYRGSQHDQRDGFIHFSRQNQVSGVLLRHFSGQHDLLLISVQADALGPELRFEASFDGQQFPHLYGTFDPALAIEVKAIGA